MKDGKKLVYSGDSLRRFLHRKGLTYKDAAKELGLDKNTIGKAVRGGNMNKRLTEYCQSLEFSHYRLFHFRKSRRM